MQRQCVLFITSSAIDKARSWRISAHSGTNLKKDHGGEAKRQHCVTCEPAADVFAAAQWISDRLDVLDAEKFFVANLHERGGFRSATGCEALERWVYFSNLPQGPTL